MNVHYVVCNSERMANSILQDIALGASLTEEVAGAIFEQGREAAAHAVDVESGDAHVFSDVNSK